MKPDHIRLELMSNLGPRTTGIEGVVIWASTGEFIAGDVDAQHGPRVVVVLGERLSGEALKDAVSVRLTDPPDVTGTLPPEVQGHVVSFVSGNRDVFLRYWHCEISTSEMVEHLKGTMRS